MEYTEFHGNRKKAPRQGALMDKCNRFRRTINLPLTMEPAGFIQPSAPRRKDGFRTKTPWYSNRRFDVTSVVNSYFLDMASVLRVSVNEILGLERRASDSPITSRRWAKRMALIENLPDPVKKHILRTLDDVIKANTRLSIFEDG